MDADRKIIECGLRNFSAAESDIRPGLHEPQQQVEWSVTFLSYERICIAHL